MAKSFLTQALLPVASVTLLLLQTARADSQEHSFTKEQRSHWSLQPVARPTPPAIDDSWIRNPIDAFVLAELKAKGIRPSEQANKITLIRRASLDLIGLPPTPEEVQAFLSDQSPKAFERVVERLLTSPHYGERWARHWLDLARYAESEGFKADETRPNAWRYRDYVIRAFNDDKPYDRFIKEQIAGDELWPEDPQAFVATAFNRHYPDESNARNLMQRRQEILNDITDTVGAVFTGVTYACARCHDHKYDPILQADYYRLQAFFANSAAADDVALVPPARLKEYRQKLADWEEKTRPIRDEMAKLEEPYRREIIKDFVDKYPEEIQTALNKPEIARTAFECQMVAKANLYLSPASHQYIAPTSAVVGKLKGDAKKRWQTLDEELKTYAHLHPGEMPKGTGIHDLSDQAPKTFLLRRGNWESPIEAVEPGFLSILNPKPADVVPASDRASTGRRSALAKILTDPENPLTARVMVNRVWHHHFGRGLVATPSDFGMKGERPTHPELLDWLASEFVKNGWSLKSLHRLILASSTYQQTSDYNEKAAAVDPEDRLFWRYPRQRLEGEVIRDSMLAVSGRLNPKMGGPSIFPALPKGMASRGGWSVTREADERDRRSIYVFVRRNTRYPMFETFDMPDTHESCSRRNVTTSPLQALTMLNSDLTLDWARSFAGRVIQSGGLDRDRQIETAYQLAYSRSPAPTETQFVKEFFKKHRSLIAERLKAGEKLALPADLPEKMDPVEAATLVDLCHMLMNANEFVYQQ